MTANVRLDPALAILIVCGGSALFALAAIHKLRAMREFGAAFANYGLPPALLRLKLSWAIPALEPGAAAGLGGAEFAVAARGLAGGFAVVYSRTNPVTSLAGPPRPPARRRW